jgi:WD40 repeat protein
MQGKRKGKRAGQRAWPDLYLEWDVATAQQPCQLDLPMALLKMRAAVFSGQHRLAEAPDRPCSSGCPDRLATAATDGTVRLWDLASQHQLGVALPQGSGVLA